MTLAIMALLMGGLTFTANAQIKVAKPNKPAAASQTKKNDKKATGLTSEKKEAAKAEKKAAEQEKLAQSEDWNAVIKEFELTVEETIAAYETMQKSGDKADPKAFNKCLSKAENLQSKIEKAKSVLDRTQASRFAKAKEKLAKVYKK